MGKIKSTVTFTTVILTGMLVAAATLSAKQKREKRPAPDPSTFAFYYNWYGNEKFDGKNNHWAHDVIPHPDDTVKSERITGSSEDIASNFYPEAGTYSCSDPRIVEKQMQQIADAGVGVIAVTWWGEDVHGAWSVPLIMDKAAEKGIRVCFHIEPYPGRNALNTKKQVVHLVDKYGNHPAFYRMNGKPVFFFYDSYLTPAREWATILAGGTPESIRGTKYDGVFIGLWVEKDEERFFIDSHFDGFYTYFAATGFTFGSSPENWPYLQKWAESNGKIFIPSVGPGYADTRVRPWNGSCVRDRENGAYYDRMYRAAIDCGSDYVSITSFNEWHEGTQIEPAAPYKTPTFDYLDYGSLPADYYIRRTAYWVDQWKQAKRTPKTGLQ